MDNKGLFALSRRDTFLKQLTTTHHATLALIAFSPAILIVNWLCCVVLHKTLVVLDSLDIFEHFGQPHVRDQQ